MPIYEYACSACGQHFERKQRFSDEPVAECPECGASVRRVLHAAGIIFKGSGWYINDSKKSSGTSASEASSTSESAKETVKPAADD